MSQKKNPNHRNDDDNNSNNKSGSSAGSSRTTKNLKKLSRNLSWVLRHAALDLGLSMTPDGFVPIDEILASQHPKLCGGTKWTQKDICRIVETNDKQRFKLQERPMSDYYKNHDDDKNEENSSNTVLCIRANQGHSIKGIDPNLLLTRLSRQELASLPTIVHGTYREPWDSHIQKQGLSRMKRNHIHFASGLPRQQDDDEDDGESVSAISGIRKSCDIYIFVDAKKCADDDVLFFRSDNGVLLTAGLHETGILPVDYFSYVTDGASGNVILDQRSENGSTNNTSLSGSVTE